MNEVFLIGKIVTNIEFKFIINNKYKKSIVMFNIQTPDMQIVKLKAYNETADYIYRSFKKDNYVFCYGSLNDKFVKIDSIKSFDITNYI